MDQTLPYNFHCGCHDSKDRKKCHKFDLLFTVDRQQDEVALAKMGLHLRPMSTSCRLTKVIGIWCSSFHVIFVERFSFTDDCCFGFSTAGTRWYSSTGFSRLPPVACSIGLGRPCIDTDVRAGHTDEATMRVNISYVDDVGRRKNRFTPAWQQSISAAAPSAFARLIAWET